MTSTATPINSFPGGAGIQGSPTDLNTTTGGGATDPYGVAPYGGLVMAGNSESNPGVGTASTIQGTAAPLGISTVDPTGDQSTGASSGFDWGSILSGLSSAITSPLGSAATLTALGEYEASAAQGQTAQLTGQLTGPAQPLVTNATNQLGQIQQGLTGAPVTGGSIGQQEQAAQAAGQTAVTDAQAVASGQLPPVYQQQIQQQVQAQQQQIRSQLASQGITDASVIAMYDQQIQDNANQQSQTILNNLQTQGAQAQQEVQQTYTTLTNNAIAEFGAGMGPIEQAVNLTVQQNTQIANGLQTLFGQIARGFSGATGAAGAGAGTAGGGVGQIASQLGKTLGNNSNTSLSGDMSQFSTDLSNSTDLQLGSVDTQVALDNSTALATQNVASDVASSNDAWLSGLGSDLGFSSAGGEAATAGAGAAAGSGLQDLSGMSISGLDAVPETGLSAASSGADAASASSGLSGLSGAQIGGAITAPLSLYNEVNSWQSGATGTDALSGAETGAAIGTAIMPGIGTAIGAAGGAIAGAISSLFGSGKTDPENADFNSYTQAFNKASASQQPQVAAAVTNPYIALAGYFDLKSDQVGTSNTVYGAYGRMGEQAFTNDLITQVKGAQSQGMTDPTQIWSQVVQPWLTSKGSWSDGSTANSAAMTALVQNMTGQIAAGTYQTNFKAVGGDSPW